MGTCSRGVDCDKYGVGDVSTVNFYVFSWDKRESVRVLVDFHTRDVYQVKYLDIRQVYPTLIKAVQ